VKPENDVFISTKFTYDDMIIVNYNIFKRIFFHHDIIKEREREREREIKMILN